MQLCRFQATQPRSFPAITGFSPPRVPVGPGMPSKRFCIISGILGIEGCFRKGFFVMFLPGFACFAIKCRIPDKKSTKKWFWQSGQPSQNMNKNSGDYCAHVVIHVSRRKILQDARCHVVTGRQYSLANHQNPNSPLFESASAATPQPDSAATTRGSSTSAARMVQDDTVKICADPPRRQYVCPDQKDYFEWIKSGERAA